MDILRAAPLSANQQVSHSCPMSCPCHVTLDLPRKCAPPPRSPYIRQTEDKIRDLILILIKTRYKDCGGGAHLRGKSSVT